MKLFDFTLIEAVLLSVLGLFFLIQLLYQILLYNRVHKHTTGVEKGKIPFSTDLPPLSVIICAKNETENLRNYLPAILEQDYPQFEVVVVNDSSSDDSEDFLKLLENKYPHLYHTFTPDGSRYVSRKKLAITVGIKASKYEWLVFTEANCYPASKEWLRFMARNFTEDTGIVLGYSGFEQEKGWLSLKSRMDNLFCVMRYLSAALLKKPYMGSGRNLAYRKELFFHRKGFSSHLNLQRGEDDLFINEIATPANTRVETDKDAIIKIKPLKYQKEWQEEKMNYATNSLFFKGMQRYLMGAETFTRIIFYLVFMACLLLSMLNKQWIMLGISSSIFLIRYIVQAIIFNKTSTDLGEGKYYFFLPVFDLLQPCYTLSFKIKRMFRKKREYMRK